MTWLTESPTPIYVMLALAAAVLLAVFVNTKRGVYLVMVGVIGLLAAGVWLTDYLVATDREQVEDSVRDLAAAVEDGDFAAFERHISQDFYVDGGGVGARLDRAAVLDRAKKLIVRDPGRDIIVSGLEVKPSPQRQGEQIADFSATVAGNFEGYHPATGQTVHVTMTYKKDRDSVWRVRHWTVQFGTMEIVVPK